MKTLVISILAVMFLGCSGNMENASDIAAETSAAVATPVANASSKLPSDLYSNAIPKLIKTAHYRFEVENMDESLAAIEEAMRRNNAFMASSDLRSDAPMLQGKITIRVPSDFFDVLLKEIDKQAKYVNFRDVRTEDVAKQFVDLESRLKTKREVELRYMDILRKKAGTIEELLKAEQQIGELHEEIEATISKINFLKGEVRYSTINLEFYQELKVASAGEEASTLRDMREALASGWQSLIVVVTGVLYLWPFIILAMGGIWLYRVNRKRHRLA
jgi:hypothetical protein